VLCSYEQRWVVEEGFHGLDDLGTDGELLISPQVREAVAQVAA
jgi:uroporphyrin-III C-methyltransferase